MSESSIPLRLLALWRRRAREPVEDDIEAADVGTAFGLELSMLPDDENAPVTLSGPGSNAWWRRLRPRAVD